MKRLIPQMMVGAILQLFDGVGMWGVYKYRNQIEVNKLMRGFSRLRLLAATAFSLVLLNSLGIELQQSLTGQGPLLQGDCAEARSTGGRSRGGSFNRRPSGGGSSGGSSGSSGGGYSNPSYRNDRPYSNPGPVFVPIPGGGYGGGYVSPGGAGFGMLVFLLIFLLFPIAAMYLIRAGRSRSGSGGYGVATPGNRELANDIVTVTKLQIALLAQARYIQESLTELTLNSDTETPEGLTEMLRETVLALMRAPENWTHVRAVSETVRSREAASQLFEKISIEERSKFSSETLAKVGGRLRRQEVRLTDEGPASYIVVTLVVGTEDDRPVIPSQIHSSQELQAALQRIGAITPEYLLVYELLWSPQDARDSLTYDELLSEYPDLVQI